mgnify:CR=1 FL=1
MSPTDGAFEAPARLFAALGDPTRIAIVRRLSTGEACSIAALAKATRLTRQAVTKHLHVLDAAGLVRGVRAGRESRYAFEPGQLEAAQAYLAAISAQWDDAIERLRTLVED